MAFLIFQLCIALQFLFISQSSAQDCKDDWGECPTYANAGFCETNPNFQAWCKLSCKVCTPGCQDTAQNCAAILTIPNICAQNERVRTICCNACSNQATRPEWSNWSDYSSCSVTCDWGTMERTRTCSIAGQCSGRASSTERCKLVSCKKKPYWGKWSAFGPCSVTCGRGQRKRSRDCIRGTSCEGSSQDTDACNAGICPPKPDGWSQCTRTCGTGTQFKFDSSSCKYASNPKCFRTFRECNTRKCPRATCYHDSERRYGQDHACCKLPTVGQRVLLGEKAKQYQWPWMVLLLTSRNELCGGTLIHDRWVMTAGHCVTRGGIKVKPRDLHVYVGILRLQDRSNKNKYSVNLILDNDYKSLQNDIALLRLTKTIKHTLSSRPIDLPQGEVTPVDSICYATGWGLTSPNPPLLRPSDPLMEVSLQILDLNVCQKAYQADPSIGNYVMNSNKLMCAGSLTKMNDVCRGDSGGPLVCQRCSSCDWYIAGITSFGPKGTCGKQGSPGMFTKVTAFESWIRSKISELPTRKQSCS